MRPNEQPARCGRLPHRTTDRVEKLAGWLLATLALLGLVLIWGVAAQLHADQAERARVEAATRTAVGAVLLRDTTPWVSDHSGEGAAGQQVPVRWVDHSGQEHRGSATVREPTVAGQTVTVWVDRNQRLVPAPLDGQDAIVGAILVAALMLTLLAVVLSVLWYAVRRWTFARDCAYWGQEWALVEPVWSGRTRGPNMA